MALAGEDTAGIDSFTDALTQDPHLVALRDRVTVVAHSTADPHSIVTITTKDGALHQAAVNVAIPMRGPWADTAAGRRGGPRRAPSMGPRLPTAFANADARRRHGADAHATQRG